MKYRHQEWKDGFVNFDNNIFLSLDLCLYLRHSIEEHTAIGRVVGTLEKQYDVLLPKQKIIKGFFLFDSLSNHNFDFNCLLYGYHPMILTFDCTRKACFQENDWSMEDNCPESDEVVDPVNFWKRITLYSIADGLSSGKANPFKDNVNTSNWSSWISTKNCNIVINTEGKKGENSDTAEGDPLDIISEERLEELLLSGTVSTLRELCSECGFPMPNGTKLACIAKLKSVLETNTSFNKTFFKIWGASGGIVLATCPHGVVYGSNWLLKAESPRDVVNILFSMKHPPNIIVSDMAPMVASHANKRRSNFFKPQW